jgi:hypothetical protein
MTKQRREAAEQGTFTAGGDGGAAGQQRAGTFDGFDEV